MIMSFLCAGILTTKYLGTVQAALWDARPKWYNIGIQLGIDVTDLDVIRDRNMKNADECITEMLVNWLRNASYPPTWDYIVKALQSPTINLPQIAETIEHNYLSSDPQEGEDSSKTHQAAVSEQAKQASSPVATKDGATFKHIKKLPSALTDEQKEQLDEILKIDSENIQLKYYTLRDKFFDSLEMQRLPIKKLVHRLKGLKVLKRLRSPKAASALQCYESVLDSIKDIERVKKVIEENSTFFDFRSLEYMIENVGLESDKKQLKHYKEEFELYIKRRIFECPYEIGAICIRSPDSTELFVKLESDYEKLVELKQFQYQLSFVLEVSVHVLRLSSVKDGCIEIIFLIPNFVQETSFPLSPEQEAMLLELGVVKLSCGDYHFPTQVIICYKLELNLSR